MQKLSNLNLNLVFEVHVSTGGRTGFSGCPVDFVVAHCGYQKLVNVGGGRCTAVVCDKLCGSAAEKVTVSCCLVWILPLGFCFSQKVLHCLDCPLYEAVALCIQW